MPDMSIDAVKKLNDSFKQMGVKEVHITGGEPLLNKDVFKIISFLHQNGYLVRIQSNGSLIDESIAQKLKQSGANHVLISVDGLTDSHNQFRGNDNSFDLALNAAKICLDKNIFTRINTVVSRSNIGQLKELMLKVNNLNVDQHSFFYLTPMGRGKNIKSLILSLREWKDVQEDIFIWANEIGCFDKIRIQDVFHENDVSYDDLDICRDDNCLILANGDVYHCVFFVDSPYSLGNIYKEDISQIWSRVKDMLNNINSKRKKSCNLFNCGGGCPGMSYCFGDDISKCDPRCESSKTLISSCIRRYRK